MPKWSFRLRQDCHFAAHYLLQHILGDFWPSEGLDQYPPVFEKGVPRLELLILFGLSKIMYTYQLYGWDGGDTKQGRLQDFGKESWT